MKREERVAKNSAMFREVNERILEGAEDAGFAGPTLFICECGDIDCGETIEVSIAEYEHARESPTRFIVAPGHYSREFEHVVAENEHYALVEMSGAAAVATAELFDPRT